MKIVLLIPAALIIAGCAQQPRPDDINAVAGDAAQSYTRCVSGQVERDASNPVGAEELALAAHGRCWREWQAYRSAANESLTANARTPEEMQLARDKADAHFRQFERETRRAAIDAVVERSLGTRAGVGVTQ